MKLTHLRSPDNALEPRCGSSNGKVTSLLGTVTCDDCILALALQIRHAALAKGWSLLNMKVVGDEAITLCKTTDGYRPFACHLFNPVDGAFVSGFYEGTREAGWEVFNDRMARKAVPA